MFALRTISNGIVSNQDIGLRYSVIHREKTPEYFRDKYCVVFNNSHVADTDPSACQISIQCYAFIVSDIGTFPLYKNDENYIMTESGRTFENISY